MTDECRKNKKNVNKNWKNLGQRHGLWEKLTKTCLEKLDKNSKCIFHKFDISCANLSILNPVNVPNVRLWNQRVQIGGVRLVLGVNVFELVVK